VVVAAGVAVTAAVAVAAVAKAAVAMRAQLTGSKLRMRLQHKLKRKLMVEPSSPELWMETGHKLCKQKETTRRRLRERAQQPSLGGRKSKLRVSDREMRRRISPAISLGAQFRRQAKSQAPPQPPVFL